ncbi:transposase [Streptomyces sp. NPDC060002]|uniref:transposase n=1 Tax=Streptomyces sp. NPDC060002 TaxID=3347033 RepID=UPI0036B4307C
MPLADAQRTRIEPSLPARTPKRGGRRRDHREVIDAIAYKFQTALAALGTTTLPMIGSPVS